MSAGCSRQPSALPLCLLLVGSACVAPRGGWDPAVLRAHPQVAEASDSRLTDALPFLALDAREAKLLLCRWPTERALRVSLPSDATPTERDHVMQALAAWAGAGLGIEFALSEPRQAQIEIVFGDEASVALQRRAALTVAVCSIPQAGKVQLAHARVHLRRREVNVLGELVPMEAAPFVGSAMHEIGHALGYNGHAALGASVMVRDVEVVKEIGQSVLDGQAYRDATLRALYRLPSGFVVGTRALTASSRALLSELERDIERSSAERGWTGPLSRVGGRWARFFFLGSDAESAGLRVRDYPTALRSGKPLELRPIPQLE